MFGEDDYAGVHRGSQTERKTCEDMDGRHHGGDRMLAQSVIAKDGEQRRLEEAGPFSVQPSELMKDNRQTDSTACYKCCQTYETGEK
jgi:hypothetical protein